MNPKTLAKLNKLKPKAHFRLKEDGDNGKSKFIVGNEQEYDALRIEVSLDDCDRKASNKNAKFLVALWNAWPEISKQLNKSKL